MKVIVKSSRLVKPAEPTWNGRLPLGELDYTGNLWHIPTIYFYRPSKDWLTPNDIILKTLERSLGHALVHFYPLAGRLHSIAGGGGRMELDCNAAGVRFIEAEVDVKLDDQRLKTLISTEFRYLCPPTDYVNLSLEEIPLLLVQVTRFICGAVSIAMTFSHAVGDGTSMFHFYSEWARLSRGKPLRSPPLLDRKTVPAGDPHPPPRGSMMHDPYNEDLNELPTLIGNSNLKNQWVKDLKIFKLTKSQVDRLKRNANKSLKSLTVNGRRRREYSRYEALAAHIWRSSCRAHNHAPEQPTTLSIVINTRPRYNPPLPETYFANAAITVRARSNSGEIVSKPLEFALSKVRETIERCADPGYIDSLIDFLRQEEDLTRFQNADAGTNVPKIGFNGGNPNIMVVSWLTLPIYDKDFGWGRENHMGVGNFWNIGEVALLPGQSGDGSVDVRVPLQAKYMAAFEKSFYEDIDRPEKETLYQ